MLNSQDYCMKQAIFMNIVEVLYGINYLNCVISIFFNGSVM